MTSFSLISAEQEKVGSRPQVLTHATVRHDPRFEEARATIMKRVARDIPSFAIGVAQKGDILWEEAFGWADREARTEATPRTIYPIASIAKSITATGVMVLRDRGSLHLDDQIDRYVEDDVITPIAGKVSDVTVRQVLSMTAGFPMGFEGIYEPHQSQSTRELLKRYGGILVFPPGSVFHYSNFSFGVAEVIIEGASRRRFDRFMKEAVFNPLGMSDTYYDLYETRRRSGVASTYDEAGEKYLPYRAAPAGGAGASSSVADLMRYALFHLKQRVPSELSFLETRSLDQMHSEVTELSGGNFALGWWVLDIDDELRMLVSDGHGMGAAALIYLLPSEGIAVVALMNTRKEEEDWFGRPFTNKIAADVIDHLIPHFKNRLAAYYEKQMEERGKSMYEPSKDLLGSWEGTVRDFAGDSEKIKMLFQEDGDIHVTIDSQFTTLVRSARISEGLLWGSFSSWIRSDEPIECDQQIDLRLRFTDGKAQGYLMSNFDTQRGEFSLPSYVQVEKSR